MDIDETIERWMKYASRRNQNSLYWQEIISVLSGSSYLLLSFNRLGTQKYADVTRVGDNTNMKEELGIVQEKLDWSIRNGLFFYMFKAQGYRWGNWERS